MQINVVYDPSTPAAALQGAVQKRRHRMRGAQRKGSGWLQRAKALLGGRRRSGALP
jgi:hypothetical protein